MVQPEPAERERERRAGVGVTTLQLRQTGNQELGIGQRRERALETRPSEEPHRRGVQLLRIAGGDQQEQARGLVQLDVLERCGRRAGSQEITTGDRAAQPRQRGTLSRHERMFARIPYGAMLTSACVTSSNTRA